MKEKLLNFIKGKNTAKILFIAGLVGIMLIFVSSFFPKSSNKVEKIVEPTFSEEEYKNALEADIKEIVFGICGDSSAIVTVTLETGIVYEYADEIKKNNAADKEKTSEESEKTYITVKDESGSEVPLIIASHMPKIRGVTVICGASNDQAVSKIEQAVCAALDVKSRQIYIGRKLQ